MIDIGSNTAWPGSALSNFAAWPFLVHGEQCASMEGFLQSLKHQDEHEAQRVRLLIGRAAKRAGRGRTWQVDGLWWLGQPIDRYGREYQHLLDEAFLSLFEANPSARAALVATGTEDLAHTIGKKDPAETVLTIDEFINRLDTIRFLVS